MHKSSNFIQNIATTPFIIYLNIIKENLMGRGAGIQPVHTCGLDWIITHYCFLIYHAPVTLLTQSLLTQSRGSLFSCQFSTLKGLSWAASGCKQRPADWCRSIEPIESPAIHSSSRQRFYGLNRSTPISRPLLTTKIIPRVYWLPEQQCYAMFTRPFFPHPLTKVKKQSG